MIVKLFRSLDKMWILLTFQLSILILSFMYGQSFYGKYTLKKSVSHLSRSRPLSTANNGILSIIPRLEPRVHYSRTTNSSPIPSNGVNVPFNPVLEWAQHPHTMTLTPPQFTYSRVVTKTTQVLRQFASMASSFADRFISQVR